MSTTWLLVRAVAAGATFNSPQPPVSSQYSSYTVQFVADQLIANDGCNTIQIAATLDAHTVTTSGDPTSTASACRKTALRDAYDRELFKASLDWRVSGKRLTLTTSLAGGTIRGRTIRPVIQAKRAARIISAWADPYLL